MATATQTMPVPLPKTPDIVTPTTSRPSLVAASSQPRVEIRNNGNKKIKVIVVADLICVWCYIAFKELNQAIDDLKQAYPSPSSSEESSLSTTPKAGSSSLVPPLRSSLPEIDVEYRPFFINTTAGSQDEEVDRMEYLRARFGRERVAEMHDLAVKRGKEMGIDFQFNAKMRQTIRVHRLLYLAYMRGGMPMQQRLLTLLFRDFFEQPDPFTIDVTSVEQLATYAVETGLIPDRKAAERWLLSRAGEEDVRRLAKISSDCGISGVPFTVVEGKWAIGGGMERGIYYKTLEKLMGSTDDSAQNSPTPEPTEKKADEPAPQEESS